MLQCVAVCCSVLHCGLQFAAAYHNFISMLRHRYYFSRIDLCYSVLQCVALCCSVLHCVLQCAAAYHHFIAMHQHRY